MKIILILVSIAIVAGRPNHQRGPGRKGNKKPVSSSTLSIHNETCGRPAKAPKMVSSYIVGGEEARPNSWPWQVSMQFRSNEHFCGGSLVRNNAGQMVVVTAAHCVDGFYGEESRWTMKLGMHLLKSAELTESKDVKVIKINKHRQYNGNTLNNDIAVMLLDQNMFADTDNISPICLSTEKPSEYVGDNCVVTGWGTLSDGSLPDCLQQVYKPLLNQSQCEAAYGSLFDSATMVCAGDLRDGKIDACQGDSGGPLACIGDDGAWKLVGVVSWGYGCGLPGYPGVYANVYNFLTWLNKNMEYPKNFHNK